MWIVYVSGKYVPHKYTTPVVLNRFWLYFFTKIINESIFLFRVTELQREKSGLEALLDAQRNENNEEREMHDVLRKHYNEMKSKFETSVSDFAFLSKLFACL